MKLEARSSLEILLEREELLDDETKSAVQKSSDSLNSSEGETAGGVCDGGEEEK